MRLAFFKRQKNKIQTLRKSKFAKFSKGCTHPRPFSRMTDLIHSQKNNKPFSSPYFTPGRRIYDVWLLSCHSNITQTKWQVCITPVTLTEVIINYSWWIKCTFNISFNSSFTILWYISNVFSFGNQPGFAEAVFPYVTFLMNFKNKSELMTKMHTDVIEY